MNLKHGGLENLVLNVVWDNCELEEGVLSVGQVQDCLNRLNLRKKWAYTTVKTILDRLTDKGFLQKVKSGKKFNYKSILSRDEMAKNAIKKLALDYFKNDFEQLVAFVNELNKTEEKSLIYVKS
ncbi:MAG: BlaI/MecI/CopY family transcriptional regulator [bacterium]|nr:BlaI/MecI/CopY family transcriptional regulator [bacterium]